MKMRLKWVALATVLVSTVALFGAVCLADAAADEASKYGGTLTLGYTRDASGLCSIMSSNPPDLYVFGFTAEPLTWGGENYPSEVRPVLATSWETSADGVVWTIHLREGVVWHDGVPFAANDVLFWAQAIQDPETGSPFRENFYVAGEAFSFEKIDEHTVRVTTAVPVPDLLQKICVPLIPEHYFMENGISNAQIMNSKANSEGCIGTGPFKIAEYRRGEAIILEAADTHWRGKRPYLDRIVIRIVPDSQSLVNAAINQEVDWFRIGTGDIAKVEDLDYISVNSVLFDATRYIALNCQSPLLADKRTRQALMYSLDRNAMMGMEERGKGLILDAPWPQVVSAYEPLPQYDYDPARARDLLAEAGWASGSDGILVADSVAGVEPGTVFELEYWATSASDKIPTLVQAYFAEVGVRLTQRLVDSSTWSSHLFGPERDYDVTSWACGLLGSDAGTYGHYYFATGDAATSTCGYHNETVFALFEEAAALSSEAERDTKYREAARILWDEVPSLFGWQRPRNWVVNTRVHEEDAVVNINLYRYYEYPELLWVDSE